MASSFCSIPPCCRRLGWRIAFLIGATLGP
jgi:hypothetical protein